LARRSIHVRSRSLKKHAYHNLVYFNQAEKGGDFAAWQEPEIFAKELRAAFTSTRNEGMSS
jgi:hypothetical protein